MIIPKLVIVGIIVVIVAADIITDWTWKGKHDDSGTDLGSQDDFD